MPTVMNFGGSLVLIVMLLSCATPLLGQQHAPSLPPRPAQISFEVVDSGSVAGAKQKGEFVIRNEQQWDDLWRDLHGQRSPRPTPPVVDFKKEMILAVLMGQQSTGGYAIEISDVASAARDIVVHVRQKAPHEDELVTLMISSPYCIVKLERIDKPVRFEIAPPEKPSALPDFAQMWREATSSEEQAEVLAELRKLYEDLSSRDWKQFSDRFVPQAIISSQAREERGRTGFRLFSVAEWVSEIGSRDGRKNGTQQKILKHEVRTFGDLAQGWLQVDVRGNSTNESHAASRIDAVTLHKINGRWRIASLACGHSH